jgi:hypothetical protein
MSRRAAPTAFLGGCGQQAHGLDVEFKKPVWVATQGLDFEVEIKKRTRIAIRP